MRVIGLRRQSAERFNAAAPDTLETVSAAGRRRRLRGIYHWIFSRKLIPELAAFDDPEEVHRILEKTSARPRSIAVIVAFIGGIFLLIYLARSFFAPLVGIPAGVAQGILQPIGMIGGAYWMYNHGLRKPFQHALRCALREKGVPLCLNCGYDLHGLPGNRCPECGRPFDVSDR